MKIRLDDRSTAPCAAARLALLAATAAGLVVAGCSARGDGGRFARVPDDRPIAGASGGSQAGSWELVFSSPGVQASLAGEDEWSRPEFTRRDEQLAHRPARAVTYADHWPQAERASLTRWRRVQVRDTESGFIYYLPRSELRRDYDRGWWVGW